MAEIDVIYKPIFSPTDGSVVYHEFLLYTDDNGVMHYARGGTTSRNNDFDGGSGPSGLPFGRLDTARGIYEPGTPDWPKGTADPLATLKSWPRDVVVRGDDATIAQSWDSI